MYTRHDQDTPYGQVISNKCHEEGALQNKEQLDRVKEEIGVSSLFNHPNLLPLLDDASIAEVICYAFFLFVCAYGCYKLLDIEMSNYGGKMLNLTNFIMISRHGSGSFFKIVHHSFLI